MPERLSPREKEILALLRSIPGMTILSPADPNEALRAVRAAAALDGPVYVRLGFLQPIEGYDAEFRVGEAVTMREGSDLSPSPEITSTRWIVAIDATGRLPGFVYYLDWSGEPVPAQFPAIAP